MADSGVPIPPQQILSAAVNPPLNGVVSPPPAPEAAKAPVKSQTTPAAERKDGTREIIETVVFVVVLVLLLKSFVAEAFVIPTGSMATTLYGYQKIVDCSKCGYQFPVNCSKEVEPQRQNRQPVAHATCPNCHHAMELIRQVEGRIVDLANRREEAGLVVPSLVVRESGFFTKREDVRVSLDSKTKIILDGREGRLHELAQNMLIRATYQLSNQRATVIEAVSKGSLPPTEAIAHDPAWSSGDRILDPGWNSGDRVLVAKFLYDLLHQLPERHDVVVFKFPDKPQEDTVPKNYIKRLIGLPGETIAIYNGDLYYLKGLDYPGRPQPEREEDRWHKTFTYENDEEAVRLFHEGKFQIIRKSPRIMLAQRRIVHDNDFQNPDHPPRWISTEANPAWTLDNLVRPRAFSSDPAKAAERVAWLRYQHLLAHGGERRRIVDFMGYNSPERRPDENKPPNFTDLPWIGDLMLECEVTVEQATGELILELSKGVNRFRARFDLAAHHCTLERIGPDAKVAPLIKKDVTLKPGTKYTLGFANFDQRLTVWVNQTLLFDDGFTYEAAPQKEPTDNDLEPASIGVQNAKVQVAHLKLWRDTYYTQGTSVKTLYVQPGHFLCLGDNSAQSADSREWGLVPQRLLLGRALMVYYPFYFPWRPFDSPVNRVGAIK